MSDQLKPDSNKQLNDVPMEEDIIIVAFGTETQKILSSLRGEIAVNLKVQITMAGL